jgi:hypothetical protein
MKTSVKTRLALISLFLGLIGSAQAQFVIKPISVVSTTISSGAENHHDGNTQSINMINGNGLSAALLTNDPIPATPTTVTAGGSSLAQVLYLSAASGVQNDLRFTFNLGAVYSVDSILEWSQTDGGVVTRRSIRNADLFYSLDNITYFPAGSVTFLSNAPGPTAPMQTGSFSGTYMAQYIRVQPTKNYANFLADGSGDNRYSVNEIRFTAAAIPEPSSFAALAGLASLGLVMARRRRSS